MFPEETSRTHTPVCALIYYNKNKKEKVKKEKNKKRRNRQGCSAPLAESAAKNRSTKKQQNKTLLNKRALLNKQTKYNNLAPKKISEPTKREVPKKMEMIFILWDNLVAKHNNLVPIKNKKRTTKAFKLVKSLVNSFLRGTLPQNSNVVLPTNVDNYPKIKNTPKDFAEYLFWFHRQLIGDHCKKITFKGRLNLATFLGGVPYSGMPSYFLRFCLTEPGGNKSYKHAEYFPILKSKWAEYGGINNFRNKDYENFDAYLSWAIPQFTRWRKNLNSMSNFEDEIDVLEFFTFGTLKKFKERRKSFSTGILNQEFFKKMIEELRLFHGYTV